MSVAMVSAGNVAATIRVLFADDSAAIRTLGRYALSPRHGFAVVAEASDGAEALELFDSHTPDCVVLDVDMPGMNGFEALAEMHRRRPDVPVVMLSGFVDEDSAHRALAAGAAAYVTKSTQLTQLGETIRRVTAATVTPLAPLASPSPPGSADDSTTAPSRAELRRFEYVVSHDLAEPVRIMGGFATLLQSRYGSDLDDSGRAFLSHLVGASSRMQQMIDDLLTYSRAADLTPQSSDVPLDAAVARVWAELAGPVRERHAELVLGDLPVAAGDADMVTTILRHLVLNAITFNTAEPPVVRVAGSIVEGAAVLTVTDNGIGMDPLRCGDVFDLFRRLNTREEYPGTGTGLALCRRLTYLQGGTLVLTSTPGRGTTATLTLPATTDHPGDRT